MTVTVRPRLHHRAALGAPLPVEAPAAPERPQSARWFTVLGIPFVLGAAFFGLALALGEEWPIAPAFVFGPLLMVGSYIYLCLTSDSNTTG